MNDDELVDAMIHDATPFPNLTGPVCTCQIEKTRRKHHLASCPKADKNVAMKSPIVLTVEKDPKTAARYSDLQVMKSNAGYYIGTIHTDEEGFQEPGSRDSDYYPTREEAQKALDDRTWVQRDL